MAGPKITRSHKTLLHSKFIKGKDAGGFYTTAETSKRKLNNIPRKSSLTKNDVYDSIALLGVSGQSDGIKLPNVKYDESGDRFQFMKFSLNWGECSLYNFKQIN